MLTFPADKSDFSAPNGVTYAWDGTLTASGASKLSAASTTLSSNCRTKLPLQTNQK